MLNELSEFLRYSLMGAKASDAPLRDEIEAARNYLAIEKIRYEDKLSVKFDIEPSVEDFRIPTLLIHPLVENALKYGMQTSALPLEIAITARGGGGSLRLEVTNSGAWVESSSNGSKTNGRGAGIGLENIRQRLEQAFPQGHHLDVFEQDGRVRAVVQIGFDRRFRRQTEICETEKWGMGNGEWGIGNGKWRAFPPLPTPHSPLAIFLSHIFLSG
jgi:LytS/YehU family sensor histidine kinase